MAFDPINYLALYDIAVYEIIGGVALAITIGLIIIGFFSAKYAVPFQVDIIMLLLFLAIMAAISGNVGMWIIIISIIAGLTWILFSRIIRRG